MEKAPIPENEKERLAALYSLHILDTPAEERFDRITRIAVRLFSVPISTVTLVDSNREWFKSCQGLPLQESDRAISFCGHALLAPEVFVIPDTLADSRFADNPLVAGEPHIRFYAGQALLGPAGQRVGTLCIKDLKPRQMTDGDIRALRDLAAWAELELNVRELSKALEARKEAERVLTEKMEVIEKMNKFMVERELRMIELKKKIAELEQGRTPR